MQLKTPREYATEAMKEADDKPIFAPVQVIESAVKVVMHDFIMLLCQADYSGTSFTNLISDILFRLDEVDDPRQRKLDFTT